MANKTFVAQLEDIILVNETRMVALVRLSVDRVIEAAQLPTTKGGDMRVDTGFLRNSGQLSPNGLPSGPTRGDKTEKDSYQWSTSSVDLVLANYVLGQSLFFGWTANYAKYRNAYDGFLDNAVQKWPQIVAQVTAEIKAKIK